MAHNTHSQSLILIIFGRNVVEDGFGQGHVMKFSDRFDCIQAACVCPIYNASTDDSSSSAEQDEYQVILGTFGCVRK